MKTFDFAQRLEEIQIALARLFDSPKTSNVSLLEEGDAIIAHMSWVVDSHRDSTLDARCAATIHATRAQLEGYAGLGTAQRRTIQQRIQQCVRARFEESRDPAQPGGACSFDVVLDEAIFRADKDNYFPSIE
ncbi:hypothetical protein ACFSHT_31305 [Paraburkholderia silviterrae]|uniref:Uncharacterized protein n=1 Tax=Paraburkholderia silviterrae TaxID=2528715 RepID=A0A4R5M3H5_9BURK|nr:hypothetical protein [Paraburkholderia silviterrae]TDG20216.1 hypothetical protein EYW47_27390 [Paraburkholderia silviterrae]